MSPSREQSALRVMSGEDRSVRASLLRGALAVAEPFYVAGISARNALYDAGIFASHRLSRPTISVGNLTTGGTGKTPVVRWLAEQLAARNLRPAVLIRGYRAEQTGGESDEARMLRDLLSDRATVIANPNRVAGAAAAMRQTPPPDVFLLDDAFQHRRVLRDFDLVLVNAAEPFGFGHVLPRGLLRERLNAMQRANAVVVTRADAVTATALQTVTAAVRHWNNYVPIYIADHVHAALATREGEKLPIETLREKRFFAFSGIASPASLKGQFASYGATFAGFRAFPDHHAYTADDLQSVSGEAAAAGAEMIVTTEKDWVKVEPLPSAGLLPIVRTELQVRFRHTYAEDLMSRIMQRVTGAPPPPSSAAAGAAAATPGAGKAS